MHIFIFIYIYLHTYIYTYVFIWYTGVDLLTFKDYPEEILKLEKDIKIAEIDLKKRGFNESKMKNKQWLVTCRLWNICIYIYKYIYAFTFNWCWNKEMLGSTQRGPNSKAAWLSRVLHATSDPTASQNWL
jgi:hypothetical protein